MISTDRRRTYLGRQLASMALSAVHVDHPMALLRAAAWHNALLKVGLHLPLFIVFDLGVLLSTPRQGLGLAVRSREGQLARLPLTANERELVQRYRQLLEHVAGSDVAEKLSGLRLRDELIAVLLSRILGDVYNRWRGRNRAAGSEPLPLDASLYEGVDFADLAADFDHRPWWLFVEHATELGLHIYTQVELIDLDTVRLLGLFKEEGLSSGSGLGGAIDLVDLLAALGSPEAHDVASFALDLLPSVLETRRAAGVQSFAVDGYASIERKGNIDSIVLSELAYDRDIFEQKVADAELLYYGREREREDERRLQYILIDSSASMRGHRQVFARSLALTLTKKLTLEGDEVWLRFFDARLHETIKVSRSSQVPVPYLLSFRSQRGRNASKVIRQLGSELSRQHDRSRNIVLYIITHGQCHIPPELLTALGPSVFLYGIIVLPSSDVLPDFTSVLGRLQIVDADVVASRSTRQRRALDIVEDASGRRSPSPRVSP